MIQDRLDQLKQVNDQLRILDAQVIAQEEEGQEGGEHVDEVRQW